MKLVNGTAYMYAIKNSVASNAPVVCVTRDQLLALAMARACNPKRPGEEEEDYSDRIVYDCISTVACVESEAE